MYVLQKMVWESRRTDCPQMLLFRGVVAELRSARHDACSPLFRGPCDCMTAAVVQVIGVCVCVCMHACVRVCIVHSGTCSN